MLSSHLGKNAHFGAVCAFSGKTVLKYFKYKERYNLVCHLMTIFAGIIMQDDDK